MGKVEWGFVVVVATVVVVCSIFGIRDLLMAQGTLSDDPTLVPGNQEIATSVATVIVLLPIAILVGLLDLLYKPVILPRQFHKAFGFRPLKGEFEQVWVGSRLWALAKEVKDAVTKEAFRQAAWLAKECGFNAQEDYKTYLLPA